MQSGHHANLKEASEEIAPRIPAAPKTNRPQQRYLKGDCAKPDAAPLGLSIPAQTYETGGRRRQSKQEAKPGDITDKDWDEWTEQKAKMIESEHLERCEQIGTGSMATVYKGLWKNRTVAIKSIHVKVGVKQQISLAREISIMTNVSHDNLVVLHGVANSAKIFDIIMEYCAGGDCFDLVHNTEILELTVQQEIQICYDVSIAMKYLHDFKPQIIHRDLKSLNVLLKEPVKDNNTLPCAKISDFGLAKMNEEAAKTWEGKMSRVGTSNWMAPEVVTGRYDEKIDVYSYAMFMYEVICSEIPFAEYETPHVCRDGIRPDLEMVPCDCPPLFAQLMQDCWAHKPNDRPPFREIVETMTGIHRDHMRVSAS